MARSPQIELIATGGVAASNARGFLEAGAVAVGIGGALVRSDPAVAALARCLPRRRARFMSRFAGRTVFVAGSTGLAASAAQALAAEGARVFVASRTEEHARELASAIEASGGEVAWATADLADEGAVEGAFAACAENFGARLDALYHVAGISGRRFGDGPVHEATLEGWEAVMRNNATSTFLTTRAAVRRMREQEPDADGIRGAILLMSSVLASAPAPAHFATHAYAASKGAIEAFTRATAGDLRHRRDPGECHRPGAGRDAHEPACPG